MVVGSEEMENNGCFMPIISSEKDSEIFFSKLKGYTLSNKIFYYKSKAPKTKKIFIVKNSLLDSGLLNINPNLKSYLKDSRYPKNFSYAFYLFFTTNDNNELSIHIGCECVNVDFIREDFISDNTKYYNRIVFEFEYALKEEYKLYNSINKP
ncbi:hypothetical protein HpHA283_10970 [Helicobacter pylori]